MTWKLTLLFVWMVLTFIGPPWVTASLSRTATEPPRPAAATEPLPPTTTTEPLPPTTTTEPLPPTTTTEPLPPTTTTEPLPPTTTTEPLPPTTTTEPLPPTTTTEPLPPTTTTEPLPPTTTTEPLPPTTTTEPLPPTTTTEPLPPTTTTEPLPPTTTTEPLPPTTTTEPLPPTTTTEPLPPTTTTEPLPPTTTTEPLPPTTTTEPLPPTTTTEPPPPTTTEKPGPCQSNPCGDGSTCEPRENGFVCLCQPGDRYDEANQVCTTAKVFPGEVNLQRDYKDTLADKTSQDFKDLEVELREQIFGLFETDDKPEDCVVEEFQRFTPTSRAGAKVKAIYQLFYKQESSITSAQVEAELKNKTGCVNCDLIKDSEFTTQTVCDRGACDEISTNCVSEDGSRTCSCKDGYVITVLTDRACFVACPDGEYMADDGCKTCSFGWTGFNCRESWKLVLVIVGSVFGGLLLATSIGLIIMAVKPSKNGSKKAKHSGTGNPSLAKGPLINGTNGLLNKGYVPDKGKAPFPDFGVPRIPRATTDSSWDNRTNLEMTPSNSRQNLVPSGKNSRLYEEHNEINPYSRPQNVYAQARPQNPYDQNRANVNPYAQNQGRTNPYNMDNDRRRY
ncbi:mucin-13-like [Gouania willdenowi]|uniref:mucin-13-like n=1 Tax=Gouania willdenowi TaxID=441366 RepID=UPI001056BD5D|nr:mucin-13-like [Gouania willdenowi]